MKQKILMTLALLMTAASGAWADIAQGDVFMFGSYIDFGTSVWCKTFSGGTDNDAVVKSTKLPLTYGGYENGKHKIVFNSVNGSSFLYIVDTNSSKPWGIKVTGGEGTDGSPFTFSTVYDWPNNCPQELIIGADGACSFAMPASDATVDYELVRDMTVDVDATIADRIRIKKDGTTYVPVTATELMPVITDALDEQNPVIMVLYDETDKTGDYTVKLQKKVEGDTPSWADATALSVGTFRYVITGANLYDGEITTNEFQLFEGYEVTIPAGEYITYYRDEPLKLDNNETNAELYTISAVGTETATLSGPYDAMKALTPMLVHNKNTEEAKTILLIPCNEPDLALTVAPEFKGTLEATEIAASSATSNNYAFNGKQFVWVKTALAIGQYKAWLEIPAANNARALTLVFGDATKITNTNLTNLTNGDWYDLNGRKLQGKPTKKGVYIMNGRKVVVK